ncbi:MAG: PAS domain S-box protein [bacterium]|nr:PAS domain S-box protein [bacterium]
MNFYYDKFSAIRKKNKLKLKSIATSIGRTYDALRKWENADRVPSESDIRRMAEVMNISVSEISDLADFKLSSTNKTDDIYNLNNDLLADKYIDEINTLLEKLGDETDFNLDHIKHLCKINIMNRAEIELLKNTLSNNRYILDNAPVLIYVKDITRRYKYVNNTFVITTNIYEKNDIIGAKASEIFGLKEILEIKDFENETFKTGERILNKKIKIPGTNGKKIGLISLNPLMKDGNIEKIICIIKDITDLEKTIDKYSRLVNTINASNYCFYIKFDDDKKYELQAKSVELLTGRSRNEFITDVNLWENIVHPDDKTIFNDSEKNSINGNTVKYRILHVDGTYRWIEATDYYTYDDISGRKIRYGYARDVTEEVENEQLGHVIKKYYDDSDQGICIYSSLEESKSIYTNKKFTQLTGCTLKILNKFDNIKELMIKIVHPDDWEICESHLLKLRLNTPSFKPYKIKIINHKEIKTIEISKEIISFNNSSCVKTVWKDISQRVITSELENIINIYSSELNSGFLIYELGKSKLIYINQEACQIIGWPKAELLGTNNYLDFIADNIIQNDKRKELFEGVEKLSTPVKFRIITKKGKKKYIKIGRHLINYKGKKCMFSVLSDITEELKNTELQEILNITSRYMPLGIIIKNKDDEIIYINNTFGKITGYSKKIILENVNTKFFEDKIIHPDDKYIYISHKINETNKNYKLRIISKNKRIKLVKVSKKSIVIKDERCTIFTLRHIKYV